jgi:outer membrane protein assembly factor BamB
LVAIGDKGGFLHLVDLRSGALRWSAQLSRGKACRVVSRPVMLENGVIASTFFGAVFALDPGTGTLLWRRLPAASCSRGIGR